MDEGEQSMPAQQREPITVPEANAEQVAAAAAARPATAEDVLAANRKEYGTWVAKEPIYFGTALGYNPGDAVGLDVVERHGLADEGRVVKVGTKAHKELRAFLGLPPLED
jgi:hypothetical protein